MPWFVTLPQSKSYCKLLDIPHSANGVEITSDAVETALWQSPFGEHIVLCGRPQLMRTSRASQVAQAYFEVWDSQNGTRARTLQGGRFHFAGKTVTIRLTSQSVGTPLCRKCWRWGHPDKHCPKRAPVCPRCGEPHYKDAHREFAGCCQGNPNGKPPVPPTPEGHTCPHRSHCPNCKGNHEADDKCCPFWCNQFNRDWIDAEYEKVCSRRCEGTHRSNVTSLYV
jgi:hypothetical protein